MFFSRHRSSIFEYYLKCTGIYKEPLGAIYKLVRFNNFVSSKTVAYEF